MQLRQALDVFTEHAASTRRLSPRTVASYRSDIQQFGAWAEGRDAISDHVEEVTVLDIERWAASRVDVAASTLQRNLASLSSMFDFLVKREIVPRNPVDLVDRPRCPDSQPVCLSDDQLRRMLAVAADTREGAILLTLAVLGLRRSELLNLNRGEVDLRAGRLHICKAKGGKSRVLPIPLELKAALEQYLAEYERDGDEPLFLGCHGRRLSRSALARLFDKWLAAAGLGDEGLSPHACRHGAATRWLRAGLNLRDVQVLLGHADIGVTAEYLHVTVDDIAEKLDEKVPGIRSDGDASPASEPVDAAWRDVLGRLSSEQQEALMAVAHSMVAADDVRSP